jgi:L-amino acid N-acyltransferase YncA
VLLWVGNINGSATNFVMNIREATDEDFDSIWPIISEVVLAGDTYAYPVDTTREQAFNFWIAAPRKTYIVEDGPRILGTYFIKTNQNGPGNHVCNCGYMVASEARGRGLATTLCEHSQGIAKELGYKAMQFNFVAASNQGAVKLWDKLGFETVGRLPRAFDHPVDGYVDALVMYKWL